MPETIERAAFTSAMKVFETSAFMSVFALEKGDELPQPDIAARMSYHGFGDGEVELLMYSEVLDILAENMLGEPIEGENALERRQDALKEVLNMICGNFLTEWAGEDPVFELSPPEIIDIKAAPDEDKETTAAASPEREPGTSLKFNLEGSCAEIIVRPH